jgi:hypothetical protein
MTVLWMSRCSIRDLDGMASFSCLKELYLSYNEITSIEDLSRLEQLQVLDLEGYFWLIRNEISQVEQIEHLALCTELRDLTLEGNPLQFPELQGVEDEEQQQWIARNCIMKILTQLDVLDDIAVVSQGETVSRPSTSYGRRPPSPATILDRPSSSYGRDTSSTLTMGTRC